MPPPGPARDLPPPTAPAPLLPWLLAALAPTNRTRVKELLRSGRIRVNGEPVTRHDHPLQPGDRVAVAREGVAAGRLPVVYEDAAVVVIDKPAGLLTVSAGPLDKSDTAFRRLSADLAARRAGRPFVVHRLDRGTSGLLLFARTPAARDQLQADWANVTKTYLAVVAGVPDPPEGTVSNFLTEDRDLQVQASTRPGPGAKRAVSRYRVAGTRGKYSLVEVVLETGRKHQIRVHLAGLGCPVIGDELYGKAGGPAGRLGLHAWRLAFATPAGGKRVELESPLPPALRTVGL